jgi:phage terminase small subunit
MTNAVKKLKLEEKKVILAYAQLKLKSNRLAKELDTMKQNIVDVFDRTNQNLIIVQDENNNNFGLQKINRSRMKFETTSFKEQHNSLYNEFTTKIHYAEYKAIGGDHDEQSN